MAEFSTMRERLEAEQAEKSARHAELQERHIAALAAKRKALAADPAVPPEKRAF